MKQKLLFLILNALLLLGCKEPPAVDVVIVDAETGSTIRGADVYIKKKWVGSSDADGVISLVVKDRRNVPLSVEKYGYFKRSFKAENLSTLGEIRLQPKPDASTHSRKNASAARNEYEDAEYEAFMEQVEKLDTAAIPEGCDYLGGMYSRDASFPGGQRALMRFIQENVVYPETAIDNDEQGKVYLSFIVADDGEISKVKVERGVCISLDREAKRVVRAMPNWHPGYCNARPVATRCRLPIVFSLN